ncbi:MAG: hypothetical protein RBU37_17085 [Myxococcota bacterium]|jgi:hypothetical protein|nr:hypothetical protein [Myxococcota bacterium]
MPQRAGVYIFRPTLLPLLFAAGFALSVLIGLTLLIIFKGLDLQGWLWSGLFALAAIATLVWVYRTPKRSILVDTQRGVVELREQRKTQILSLSEFQRLRVDRHEEQLTHHSKGVTSTTVSTVYTLFLGHLMLQRGAREVLGLARQLSLTLALPLDNHCGRQPVTEMPTERFVERLQRLPQAPPAEWIRVLSNVSEGHTLSLLLPPRGRIGILVFLTLAVGLLSFASFAALFTTSLSTGLGWMLLAQTLVLLLLFIMGLRSFLLSGFAQRQYQLDRQQLNVVVRSGPFKRQQRFPIDQLLDIFSEHEAQANLGRSDTGYSVYVDTGKRHPIARHLASKQADELVAALQWALCELSKAQARSA